MRLTIGVGRQRTNAMMDMLLAKKRSEDRRNWRTEKAISRISTCNGCCTLYPVCARRRPDKRIRHDAPQPDGDASHQGDVRRGNNLNAGFQNTNIHFQHRLLPRRCRLSYAGLQMCASPRCATLSHCSIITIGVRRQSLKTHARGMITIGAAPWHPSSLRTV